MLLLTALCLAGGLLALLETSRVAQAAPLAQSDNNILYVVPTGGMTYGTCRRELYNAIDPQPDYYVYPACTLDYALSIAEDGDTLRMAQGNYQQSIVITQSLTLEGGYPSGFASGMADPIAYPITQATNLMPTTATPIITIEGQTTAAVTTRVTLDGLHLFHPSAQDRAMILVPAPTAPSDAYSIQLDLINSKVRSNEAPAGGDGGGIYVASEIIASIGITNTEFDSNKANNGGAIWISEGSSLYGSNARFTNNQASGNGGAIYAANVALTIGSATFSNNQAVNGSGGALYLSQGDITFDAPFIVANNQAGGNGGGIYREHGILTLSGSGNEITNNSAQGNGGGLYAMQSQLDSTSGSVTFTSNTAIAGSGGGVYLDEGSSMEAATATFTSNSAQLSGGGLYADGATYAATSTTNASANTVLTANGGAFYFKDSQATLGEVHLSGNRAEGHGGALYAQNSTLQGSNLVAEQNHATTGDGGAIYLQDNSNLTWRGDSTTRHNQANVNGGAIYVNGSSLESEGTTTVFSNTVVTGSGGGVYLNAGAAMTLTGALTLTENAAQVHGGGLYVNEGNLSLPGGGSMNNNIATTGSGGAIYFASSVNASFGEFTLQANRAAQDGGAIRAIASTLTFSAPTQVSNNTASTGSGGGLHLTNGITTTFATLTLAGNSAYINGGGIFAENVALDFGNSSVIQDNIAQTGNGGGVYKGYGEMITSQITFLRNKAKVDGGGIYAGGALTLANNSVVQFNEAQEGNGGGIYAGGGEATLTGVLIELNTAKLNGGGLYLIGDSAPTSLVVENNSTIRQNRSNTAQGGGLFVNGGTVTLDSSTLSDNQANLSGGGLFQNGGTLTITNTATIAANRAITGSGGGLAVMTGTVTIANSQVNQNSAYADGGGLYAPGGRVSVVNSLFAENNLTFDTSTVEIDEQELPIGRGGGIYVDGNSITLDNAEFSGNSAQMGGGGLYVRTLFAHIANSALTNNNGGRGNGGAAYLQADLVEVLENRIEANQTAGNGGGLFISETPNSTIISNTLTSNLVRSDIVVEEAVIEEDVVVKDPSTGQQRVVFAAGTYIGEESTTGTGAGLHVQGSSGILSNNIVLRNENQSGEAGGLFVSSSAITLTNNLVAQNSVALSDTYASGLYIVNSEVALRHNTIADNLNRSPIAGAINVGIYVTKSQSDTSTVNVTNNIISGHQTGMMLLTGSTASLFHNLFFNIDEDWGGPVDFEPAVGNRVGDPLFVDPVNANYDIQRQSAAFDIGTATDVMTDIRGIPRQRAFGVDAGAYEHHYAQGVHMRVTATPVFVGSSEQIEYHAQVVNHSTGPLSGINLNFALPPQQSASSISGPGCSGTNCSFDLAAEGSAEIRLVATANGTPPPQGFIEMVTTVNVNVGGSGPSDGTQAITTRLQLCRIRYNNTDYPSIQAAIDAANVDDDLPDIIRVSGYCGGTFELNKTVTIQGGWNFAMTTLNPAAFPTTIDGGGVGRVVRITGQIVPTIENITLRGGSAVGLGGGPSGKDAGGTVYIQNARATLVNVRIVGGRAAYGAGVYVDRLSAPIIRDSVIEGNQASERGGGVYAHNSAPELTNVTIRNNTSKAGGGAYLYKSEAKIVDSIISGNRATGTGVYLEVAGFNIRFAVGGGGGVHFDESKASITGSTLENNTAKAGGAVFADNSPGSVTNSVLNNNEANGPAIIIPIVVLGNTTGGGGAIYAQRSDMAIEYNRITNNRSTAAPGGAIHIFNGSADAKINGNFLGYNNASKGSAVYVHLKPDTIKIFLFPLSIPDFIIPLILGLPQPAPPKLTMQNNTIAHNGGSSAVHFYGESYGELVGNIFAFNSGNGLVAETETLPYIMLIPYPVIMLLPLPFPVFYIPTVSAEHTLWYENNGDWTTIGLGAQVNSVSETRGDPAFKDDGYHIKRISAAYNAGPNIGIPVDLDGQPRPQANFTDLGADEYPAMGVRYVAPGGGDPGLAGNLCRDHLNPCGTLQAAIDSAREGDLIKMAGGTYSHMETRMGQRQIGFITKTITIQGGYYPFTTDNNVTEGRYTAHDWEVPFPDANPTILDGSNGGRVLYILDEKRVDNEGNPIKVEPVISGVIIKNGNSTGLKGPQGNEYDAGGAIYLDHTKATIRNVEISNSTADYGGGVYMIASVLTLEDVTVHNNIANVRGGGFYLETSNDVIISNITIELNKAPRGGGLYLEQSAAMLRQNQIRSNGDSATTLEGGGIYLDNSAANVISNTITANNAANGAGFYAQQSDATISGNTITNNKALNATPGNGRGGGCFISGGSTNINTNLIQGNQAILGAGCFVDNSGAILRTNQFLENVATNAGGGVYLRNSSDATLQENLFNANRANSTAVDNGGGGLFLESSNSTIRFNTITNNAANAGGGVYLFSFSNANLLENEFSNNTATQDGAGVYLKLSDAQLTKNNITSNRTAQGSGGGVYVRLSSARLSENKIEENIAVLDGGGVYLDQSGATLEADSIRNNAARNGAGIYIFRSDTAKFDRVTIQENRATQFGGGIYVRLSSVPLEDHEIASNFAQVAGGGIYIDESAVSFNRNIIRNNEAGQQGGGIAITRRSRATLGSNAVVDNKTGNTGSGIYIAGSQPKLIHTTVARNQGGDGTGVVAVTGDGQPSTVTMINSILANQSLAVRATSGNTITLEATLWDSNGQNWVLGAGVIITGSAELNFFGSANFQADGIHIQNNSKAIGVGVPTEVGRDLDGDGRPQGNGPELGADELLADCTAVVDRDLSIVYTRVQEAIDNAPPGSEVRISGTCIGAQSRAGTTQLAYVNKEITLRGGYTPTNWLHSYPITQPTFLDAQGEGRVIYIAPNTNATIEYLNLAGGDARNQGGGPSGLDAGGILYARNANPMLRGLTLTGGSAYYGGAIYLENSTSALTDSALTTNQGTKGGAVFLRNARATLRGNKIASNTAADGAGIFLSFSQSVIDANSVTLNTATAAGGGLFLESSSATLTANSVLTNTAQTAGGIYVDGAGPTVARNAINANVGQNGGGIYLASSTATVNGNQFIANSGGIGAGIYVQSGNPSLDNNVVAKNTGQIQAAGLYILSSSPKLRHNTLAANTGGDGSGLFITDLGVQPANIEMVNNIIVDHTVAITLTAGNKVTLRHNLWNNNGTDWGGSGIVDDKGGHVRADPLFVDSEGNDYHLQAASPARDRGATDAGVNRDVDNQARPADNGFDIGADEFVFTGVQVSIQTVPDPVVAGAPFQLVVRVVNIGNIDQTANITVTLPSQMTPSGELSWQAQIGRGETWVQTVDATVNSTFAGTLKLTGDVTTSAGAGKSIEASIQVARPDHAISLFAEASPSPVPAGGELVYQIRLSNAGNRPLNPTVEANLPAVVSAAAPLSFSPGELGAGGAWTKTIRTTVAPDAKGNLTATFRAITAEGPTATYTLTVPVAEPGLVTGVSATPDPVLAGRTVTYTLRVTNNGNIDFTNTITFVAPMDESKNGNGRPLVAPGADQVFADVSIPAGTTWEQTVVVVVQSGYTGPLNSQVHVRTNTGLSTVHHDTRQVILPTREPTIIAVNSGTWDDPNTWEPARVPDKSDIVLVPAGTTVTVDGNALNPIELTGLINEGTILLNNAQDEPMELQVSSFIDNRGIIRGRDGQAIGEAGGSITVQTNELNNSGTIRAGNGSDGASVPPNDEIINGGDGGTVQVFAQSIVNNSEGQGDGEILGGNGGSISAPAIAGRGGNGGDALVVAGPTVPAHLFNAGLIAAGDGGSGPGGDQGDGRGGDGGHVALLSASQYTNAGGEVRAGRGGDGNGDGTGGDTDDGSDGTLSISAAYIWDNGVMRANDHDYAFSTLAPSIVRGVAGATVLVPLTFLNQGLRADTYLLVWSNSAGWTQSFLPETVRVSGLRYGVVFVPFVIPTDTQEGAESQLRLTARSQGAPGLVQEQSVRVIVGVGERIWLPTIFHSEPTNAADIEKEAAPPHSRINFLPMIDD